MREREREREQICSRVQPIHIKELPDAVAATVQKEKGTAIVVLNFVKWDIKTFPTVTGGNLLSESWCLYLVWIEQGCVSVRFSCLS